MPARFLLDTDICVYIRQGRPPNVVNRFQRLRPGQAAVSVISYGELLYGAEKSAQAAHNLDVLQRFIEFVPVLTVPEEAAAIYGAWRAQLEAKGEVIGGNELWIAAHAKAAGLTLVTNNEREFKRITGLKIENWAKPRSTGS